MRLRTAQRYYDKPEDGAGGTSLDAVALAAADKAKADAADAAKASADKAAADKKAADETAAALPKKDWKDDRIAKLTHDLNEERRLRAATPPPPPEQKPGETPEAFAQRVDEAANAKAVQIAAQQDWDRQCNLVAEQGKKEFPDFDARLTAITSTVNGKDPAEVAAYNEVIAAAIETGEAHKVLYALGSDPGEYQRLMKLSPVKRAMELGKMAVTLVNEKEPSGMPKPITPVGSGGTHYEGITPDDPKRGTKLPMKEWMKLREKQAQEKGIQ